MLGTTTVAESDRTDPDHDTAVGAQTRPGVLDRVRAPLPGLVLCAAAAAAALVAARLLGGISPLLIAILLGAVVANIAPPGAVFEPGVAVASRRLLRIGVALLGLQLLLANVLALGWGRSRWWLRWSAGVSPGRWRWGGCWGWAGPSGC